MNQSQRNYLIKKIEESVKAKISAIESAKPKHPNLLNYIYHYVISGQIQIQPPEVIMAALKKKALNTNVSEHYNWLSEERGWGNLSGTNRVSLNIKDIMILPEEYDHLIEEYRKIKKEMDDEIYALQTQAESLITRIQLASDKTLQMMINEVDDLGDISLYDKSLRQLTGMGKSDKPKEITE